MKRNHEGRAYSVIVGRLKERAAMAEQSYRYAVAVWTEAQARSHCKNHDGRFDVANPAKEKQTMTRTLLAEPEWLRVKFFSRPAAVDRDRGVITGVIAAEEGPFKSEGRGEFNAAGLAEIVRLAKAKGGGLKSNWTHPSLSADGLGNFLGRFREPRLDTLSRDGQKRQVVRMDLHLDPTALAPSPNGGGTPRGQYVMDLAESDPEAFSTSLQLKADKEHRLDKEGRRLKNAEGKDLPPLWTPTVLHALDVVDTGDATNSFLSVDDLKESIGQVLSFNDTVRLAAQILDQAFAGQPRKVVEARCRAYLERYLTLRYGETDGLEMDHGEAGYPEMPTLIDVGDQVRILTPHLPRHETVGVVRQVICGQPVYGIGLASGEVVQWYLPSEVMLTDEEPGEPTEPMAVDPFAAWLQSAGAEQLAFSHNSTLAEGEPDWGSVDKLALPRVAFADLGGAGQKSTFKFPHHFVKGGAKKDEQGIWTDGELFLHKGGLAAAWSAAMGGRSGQKASAAVIAHLQAHRKALGLTDGEGG